jgi:hypothetical protein
MYRTKIKELISWRLDRVGILVSTLFLMQNLCAATQDANNAREARDIFNRTYQMVFGPQGSTLHYDVNIIGIYKTAGDICYKGKKQRYSEERYASWNDGVTAYMVDKKSKKVSIYKANSDKKDKYLSKFKFNLNDFEYSWRQAKEGLQINMKLKHSSFMGIREVEGFIDRKTYYPISLRIKVAFFWTTVKISRFRSGNISDQNFVFPSHQFKGYEVVDNRNED